MTVLNKKIRKWLNLPGIFVKNFPTRSIKKDGSEREMDWPMLVKPDNKTLFQPILINVEFQPSLVNKDKIKAMSDTKTTAKPIMAIPYLQ